VSWHIYPAHYVAHLTPTFQNGWLEADGYPHENVRTLDVTQPWASVSGTSGNLSIEFDRGHTNGVGLTAALLLQNDFTAPGPPAWSIDAADNAAFSTNLTSLVSSDTTKTQNIFFSFASNTQRYIRLGWASSNATGKQISCLTFGKTYQLASQGPLIATERLGDRIIRTFKAVTRANAELIMEDCTRRYIPTPGAGGSNAIDGIGGWGGQNPIALVDDSTTPATIYWGTAKVSTKPYAAYYSEVIVDMAPIWPGVIE